MSVLPLLLLGLENEVVERIECSKDHYIMFYRSVPIQFVGERCARKVLFYLVVYLDCRNHIGITHLQINIV